MGEHDGGVGLSDTGFTPEAVSQVPAELVARLAATLDEEPPDELPLLWHWALFVPGAPTAALGPDGHPRRSDAVAGYPSRMFAGGRLTRRAAVALDRPLHRRSHVASSAAKSGRGGDLIVVTVHHEYRQGGEVVREEDQDLVFKADRGPVALPVPGADAPEAGWVEVVRPSTTLLARFSAVTFNGHRIHYDRDYARDVERYPDLVVHGPLTASLLAARAERWSARGTLRSFTFRASAPAFVDQDLWLTGTPDGADPASGMELAAVRPDGAVAMSARADW